LHEFPKEGPIERVFNDFGLLSRFEEILLADDFLILITLLKVVSSVTKELEQLSRSSLNVLAPRQSALPLVCKMFETELQAMGIP